MAPSESVQMVQEEVSSSIEEVAMAEGTEESFVGEAVAVMELYSRLSWRLRERLREGRRAGTVHEILDGACIIVQLLYHDFSHSHSPPRVEVPFNCTLPLTHHVSKARLFRLTPASRPP